MSQDDDLKFDPKEKYVAHGVEHVRPLGVPQAATSVAPVVTPNSPQSRPTAATPPAIQARPVPPRPKNKFGAAHQLGRRVQATVDSSAMPQPLVAEEPVQAVPQQIAPQAPVVVQPVPEKPTTIAFEDTWLPSNCVAYAWDSIKIRRFTIEELRAVVRARVSGNLRHLVRAVDATISRPAADLTVGDFWYLMYWHRLNSYKKSPFVIQWKCEDEDHIHNVVQGKQIQIDEETYATLADEERLKYEEKGKIEFFQIVKLDPATLNNLLTVSGSNLTTEEVDVDNYATIRDVIESEYGIKIMPQKMTDLIDSLEQRENKERQREKQRKDEARSVEDGDVSMFIDAAEEEQMVQDEEESFMHRYAAVLDPMYGVSLNDRAAYLNTLDPDLLVDLEDFLEAAEHGVTETWKVQCKECRASKTVNQSLDALSFLPSLQRGGLA